MFQIIEDSTGQLIESHKTLTEALKAESEINARWGAGEVSVYKADWNWKTTGWEVRDPGMEIVKAILPSEKEAHEWLDNHVDPRRHIVLERHELVRELTFVK